MYQLQELLLSRQCWSRPYLHVPVHIHIEPALYLPMPAHIHIEPAPYLPVPIRLHVNHGTGMIHGHAIRLVLNHLTKIVQLREDHHPINKHMLKAGSAKKNRSGAQ